ncbi:MAG: hypothetical protein COX43_01715 [Parcubacteria group bacterium CG23_combo_of_CG06-09_8_20_14_all_35_9]|nr:MAG: hypothetical protein COX43_01715 [Parcubacteria group bacterium CG23_combo_of_CG06-09_8_20_14_all_35_9]
MKEHILNWNQKRILKQIEFLKRYGFYLAGGTSLALFLGHRRSKDLDFYTKGKFNGMDIIREFQKIFAVEKPRRTENALWLKIRNTDLSFFKYPYKLIRPLVVYSSVNIASIEDIAAMKMEAIVGRGIKRDFIDLYYLIKKYGLKQLLKFTHEKYKEAFNEVNYLHALMYFKDAEISQKDRRKIYLYKEVEWRDIKEYIEGEVKKYQKSLIKISKR